MRGAAVVTLFDCEGNGVVELGKLEAVGDIDAGHIR